VKISKKGQIHFVTSKCIHLANAFIRKSHSALCRTAQKEALLFSKATTIPSTPHQRATGYSPPCRPVKPGMRTKRKDPSQETAVQSWLDSEEEWSSSSTPRDDLWCLLSAMMNFVPDFSDCISWILLCMSIQFPS